MEEYYYSECLGYLPDSDKSIARTKATIAYLKDNEYSNEEIMRILDRIEPAEMITPDMLPDTLWENSLIKRGKFYSHKELQLVSKPPYFDAKQGIEIVEPFFLEIKIRYYINDLYDYYLKNIRGAFLSPKRDMGALQSMLNQYGKGSNVQSLDMVLNMIDEAAFSHIKVVSPFDLQKTEADVYDKLSKNAAESTGKLGIVWRT